MAFSTPSRFLQKRTINKDKTICQGESTGVTVLDFSILLDSNKNIEADFIIDLHL